MPPVHLGTQKKKSNQLDPELCTKVRGMGRDVLSRREVERERRAEGVDLVGALQEAGSNSVRSCCGHIRRPSLSQIQHSRCSVGSLLAAMTTMEIRVCEMEDRMETRQKQLENADVKSMPMQDASKRKRKKVDG